MFKSGVVRQLTTETLFIGSIATFICVYNALFSVGWDDFSGVHHNPFLDWPTLKLPLQPFTLSSPALGLLLGRFPAISFMECETFCSRGWILLLDLIHLVMRSLLYNNSML